MNHPSFILKRIHIGRAVINLARVCWARMTKAIAIHTWRMGEGRGRKGRRCKSEGLVVESARCYLPCPVVLFPFLFFYLHLSLSLSSFPRFFFRPLSLSLFPTICSTVNASPFISQQETRLSVGAIS